MKKIVLFLLSLFLCVFVLAEPFQSACHAAESESNSMSDVAVPLEENPYSSDNPLDGLNGLPEEENRDAKE